jgi:hypothetical protein
MVMIATVDADIDEAAPGSVPPFSAGFCEEGILSISSFRWSMFLAGCSVNTSIVDEIDNAFAARQKNDDVAEVVRRHVPVGTQEEDVLVFLHKLKADGFSVSQYVFEGAGQWPDGRISPYLDEQTKRNMERRLPKGTTQFVAQRQYGGKYFLLTKTAVVVITIEGSIAMQVEGRVNISGV